MPDSMTMSDRETNEFELMRDDAPAPAPAPEPKPDPAPAADPKPVADAPKPEAKPQRLVPLDALHEARGENKSLKARLAELEAKVAQPKPSADDDIDETQDPIGAIARLKAKIREGEERTAEQARVEGQMNEVATRVGERIKSYAAEHPEYPEQMSFLRQSRFDELTELGWERAAAIRQIQTEEMILGVQALQNDWDPGAKIAQLAKLRGWKVKDPEPGADPKPNGEVKADPAATAKLDRLERGQKAAMSSSSGGGSGPEADTTLEAGLKLEGAAFDSWWKKNAQRLMD